VGSTEDVVAKGVVDGVVVASTDDTRRDEDDSKGVVDTSTVELAAGNADDDATVLDAPSEIPRIESASSMFTHPTCTP